MAAIVDKASKRNLLDPTNPVPMQVNLAGGKPVRFALEIRNGDAGLIDLAISSDEDWVQPEQSRLTLVGGESGECIFSAQPRGESEFANLLFSWEGITKTLCQSVMIQRSGLTSAGVDAARKTGVDPSKPAPIGLNPDEKKAAIRTLIEFIKDRGASDQFIDHDEEQEIFRKGGDLGLAVSDTESVLNRLCSESGWTRQTRLTEKLTALLHEATKDDGVIDHQEFDHIVNFAVKRMMPRRDAEEHCVTLILDNAWKAKKSWLPFKKGWFDELREKHGL